MTADEHKSAPPPKKSKAWIFVVAALIAAGVGAWLYSEHQADDRQDQIENDFDDLGS